MPVEFPPAMLALRPGLVNHPKGHSGDIRGGLGSSTSSIWPGTSRDPSWRRSGLRSRA
jgi:hypothetical protein